ncbi:AraC family transcriptional regulator [Pacificimonas flava]|uniref:Transcriptional regulator, AraC family n=1 Tax=Pacificimonas flava TaxID=1234595 RepID=M2U9I5_9SPHN|nr:helix-turn-helix transcriptional regulator [Pacificimonas flava]EMD84622.1 Transcriptional regulator, AraC family [Pacificimonas flava]MBB5279510.1 AraC-like DNA-binding protein [Pacificimonas flava]
MKHFDEARDLSDLPVYGLQDEYTPGFVDAEHCHGRAQLLYASSGVMSVVAGGASFVIPPLRAIWIPSGTLHEVSCRSAVSLRTLYIDEDRTGSAARACRVIEVSDFLKALIVELAHIGDGASGNDVRYQQIVSLLISELSAMPTAPFHAPMPSDPRLLRVCNAILAEPTERRTLDDYASLAGMGRRTFTRQFRQETGMSLGIWCQQVRLLEAVSRLACGQSVTTVAFDVGYESPSAFTSMFHRFFGVPPSQYRF